MTLTNFTRSLPSPQSRPTTFSWGKRLAASVTGCVVASASLLTAAHEIPGFGPWAADTLRSAIGVEGVAKLEDTAYALRDTVNQLTRVNEKPKNYWAVPAQKPPEGAQVPFPKVAAKGDGSWVPVDEHAEMKKTMLHPDPKRTWAELFVVAIDLEKVELHWVPGTVEPRNLTPKAKELKRDAKIPDEAHSALLAAFNGGFKTQHGKFGARSENITLVPPRPHQCILGQASDGNLVLGTYQDLTNPDELTWLRQTPGCMVEDGLLHPQLVDDTNTNWGATLDGGTVIRRSALGLSEDKRTLYVGISNDTTARALALGMQSAGAHTVAQLDVNYAYPKFVLFDENDSELHPRSLIDGFVTHEQQYLRREARDFFFLTARSPDNVSSL